MALTLDLNNMFLEDFKPSKIYLITSKVYFIKGLANYKWHMFLTWFTYVLTPLFHTNYFTILGHFYTIFEAFYLYNLKALRPFKNIFVQVGPYV